MIICSICILIYIFIIFCYGEHDQRKLFQQILFISFISTSLEKEETDGDLYILLWAFGTCIVCTCFHWNYPDVKICPHFSCLMKTCTFHSSAAGKVSAHMNTMLWFEWFTSCTAFQYNIPQVLNYSFYFNQPEKTLTPKGPWSSLLIGLQEQQLMASLCAQYHIHPIQEVQFLYLFLSFCCLALCAFYIVHNIFFLLMWHIVA